MAIIVGDVGKHSIRLPRLSISMRNDGPPPSMTSLSPSSLCLPVSPRRRRTKRPPLTHMEVRSTRVGWQGREQASLEECLFMERFRSALDNTFDALFSATEEGGVEGETSRLIDAADLTAAVVSRNSSDPFTGATTRRTKARQSILQTTTCCEQRIP